MSPSDFSDMAELIASRRYSSSSAHSLSHGQSSCIISLLVTVDLPSAPVSHGPLPRSARGLKPNSPSPSAAASTSAVAHDSLRWQGSPTGQGGLQRGVSAHDAIGTCRSCIKLSFVEVGCAAAGVKQPARRVSAEPLQQTQLSRTSTSLSSFRSMSSTSSSKWAVAGSGAGPRQAGVGAGRGQDSSMRAVAEVVWAAAHGKGVPVPHRQCKLTRYLQDTLHPAGELRYEVVIRHGQNNCYNICSRPDHVLSLLASRFVRGVPSVCCLWVLMGRNLTSVCIYEAVLGILFNLTSVACTSPCACTLMAQRSKSLLVFGMLQPCLRPH